MSTNSTIVVAIPTEKRGQSYQFNKGDYKFDTPEVIIPEDANYVSVYHHWDGYPEGVGDTLNTEYSSDFDKIMSEVIAGGDMSHIGVPYHAWGNEDWEDVHPTFSADMPEITEEYQYLYSNETWFVRAQYGEPKVFTPVASILVESE